MAASFLGLWVDLAMLGVVTTLVTNSLLSSAQSPARCAPALTHDRRAALLLATCEASESGWARVVRAELADDGTAPLAGDGAYREMPARSPSARASRVFARERARIRTSAAIGLAGFVASLAGAAALMRAQPVAMGIVALVAAFVAWRLLRNVRAALDALASALRAVPALGVEVRAPPAEPRRADDVPWTRVSAPSILGYGLLGVAAIAIACLAAEAAAPMSAHEIGMLFGGQLMFGPVVLAVVALLRSASVSLDGARREVRVARRILGIAYARTSVPLEIVSGFSLQKKREGRFKVPYVVADTSEGPLDLVSGEGAEKAVAALTSRFRAR